MAATPRYAIPYAGVNDSPHGPNQQQALATAVETALAVVDDRTAPIPRGYVGGNSSNADTNITTTESIVISATFTATAGRRYKMTMDFEYYQKTGTASSNMTHKIRVIAGNTPTATGGTVVRGKYPNCRSTPFNTDVCTLVGTWTATATGQFAVSFTAKIDNGTGGIAGSGGVGTDHTFELIIEEVAV